MFKSGERALIVCAHLDDELFGVGGTIRRLVSGDVGVDVIVMTSQVYERVNSGTFQRRFTEITEAIKSGIGVRQYYWSGLVDMHIQNPLRSHIEVLEDRLFNGNYHWVFTHTEHDMHQEHVLISQATKIAARPNMDVFSTLKGLFEYEVVGSSNSIFLGSNPSGALRIAIDIEQKIEDIKKFASDAVDEFPKSRTIDSVKALALLRGSEMKTGYAEAFAVRYLTY